MFFSGFDFNILIITLNKELELIDKWFTANKLTSKSNPSKIMIFHSRQRQFPTDINEVMIDESIIERVTTMKFLWVHLDKIFNLENAFDFDLQKTCHVSSFN